MTDSHTTHPGTWSSIKNDLPDIRRQNISVLSKLWSEVHHVVERDPKWGDEVEYLLVSIDPDTRRPTLFTGTAELLKRFHDEHPISHFDLESEAYKFMLESAPSSPYGSSLKQALQVETHLRSRYVEVVAAIGDFHCFEADLHERRATIQSMLTAGTHVFTISSFGLLQVDHGGVDREHRDRHTAEGLLTDDSRYQSVVDTIFQRSNGFPTTSIPKRVPQPDTTQSSRTESDAVVLDNPIYGVGSCGLQITFGVRDLQETLFLHDQLSIIAPLTTALTAASPILKGAFVSTDARFDHTGSVVDDRQSEDLTPTPRWSLSPLYLQELPEVRALNQTSRLTTDVEKQCTKQFEAEGIPSLLSEYLAYTVCRPPLLHPKLVSDDSDATKRTGDTTELSEAKISRLESHLSNLYPAVRLKLPTWPLADNSLPWRLEFRAMEVPLNDFECAAMLVFLRLLKQAILDFRLELRIPMRLLEENMDRAHAAGAVRSQKFWFNVSNKLEPSPLRQQVNGEYSSPGFGITELSSDEIINGQSQSQSPSQPANSNGSHETPPIRKTKPYPGLLHYIRQTLTTTATNEGLSETEVTKFEKYLTFISKRASGAISTPAQWTRDFIAGHPEYKGQGDVSPEVYHDMLCAILEKSEDGIS